MKNIIEKVWLVDKIATKNLDLIFIVVYAVTLFASGILS